MHNLVHELKKHLHQSFIEEDYALLPVNSLPMPFSRDNFHALPEAVNIPLTFIDGGNAELISTPSLAVHFNRIVSIKFPNKELIRTEFYTIVTSKKENELITYHTKCIQKKGEILIEDQIFNSNDPSFTDSHQRASLTKIANYIRRCAELKFAAFFTNVIIDGTLYAPKPLENKLVSELSENTIAVSKTCSWLTKNGQTCTSVIHSLSTQPSFYYYPIAKLNDKNYRTDIAFAKFHPNSSYMFKIESNNIVDAVSILIPQTKDAAFLGYPYGLILADKFARISNHELNYFKTKLKIYLKNDWEKLKPSINATNAHSILDSM